jgi:hypothetical protein
MMHLAWLLVSLLLSTFDVSNNKLIGPVPVTGKAGKHLEAWGAKLYVSLSVP